MESTPRPILGSPREAGRLPILSLVTRAFVRRSRGQERSLHVRAGLEETVVEVRGVMGGREAGELKRLVQEALASGTGRVTIDLACAGRVSPLALAALVELARRGGRVGLARLEGDLRLLMEKAGLHAVVEIVE